MDPAWKYWNDQIGAPKLILAPMVDHSELPWRMLSREYGCQAAYTPMFHALNFASQKKYRMKNFSTCPEDRPLFVQFCANDSSALSEAAKHVENLCDGIDINLGCPQEIARRGRYGAFLQDEWNLISEMVAKLRNNLDAERLAVSCKIRRFGEVNKTVQYAQMLERAGCTFVGLHARTREQRGCLTGAADWSHIKAVKENLKIPVIANGNVQSLRDAEQCFTETGADAVMTAEGNLYNPALFRNLHPTAWQMADRYLDYVEKYPIPAGMAKSHIFKLFHRCIAVEENAELRCRLGQSTSLVELRQVVKCFRDRYSSEELENFQGIPITVLPVPVYYCQPRYKYQSAKSAIVTETVAASNSAKTKSSAIDQMIETKPQLEFECSSNGAVDNKRIKLSS